MAVNKVVQSNGTTLIDITPTTAVASDVASGKIFFLADGTQATGTNSGGGSGPTYETYFDGSITAASDKSISIPSLSSLYFASGETWRVTWDGTEYICHPNIHEGWLWYIGNHGLTDGTDDGVSEPFCLYNYGGGALNGMARTSGTHTLKLEKQTSSGGSATLITKSITANGTYNASDDSADGYSSVTVNVPSSGSSAWTKVAETSYQVSTTGTTATTVDTWATGHSEIWTSDKWVYVRVRDTEGKRNGYFYGTDTFFYNVNPINDEILTSFTSALRIAKRYNNNQVYTTASSGPSGYGVFPDTIDNNGNIRIRSRYNSSNSRTIDSTYKVEVYLLDPAGGVPIFE